MRSEPGNEIRALFEKACRDQLAAAVGKLIFLKEVAQTFILKPSSRSIYATR